MTVAAVAHKAHSEDVKSAEKVVKTAKKAAVKKVTHEEAKKVSEAKPECEVKCPVAKPDVVAKVEPHAAVPKCKPAKSLAELEENDSY